MKSNTEKAVLIIAALSLLLGLSLGQIHKQYKEIKTLKSQSSQALIQFNLSKERPVFRQYHLGNQSVKMRLSCDNFGLNQSLETTLIDLEDLNKEMKSLEIELEELKKIHPVIEVNIPEIRVKK